jgi:putative ABC transport system permease protein
MLFKLIRESLAFALHEISVNKLRTLLSLLGITIGIFSVISVLTIFDSLEIEIRESLESLGNDVLYIQKWPWTSEGGEYAWWEFMKRPEPRISDMKEIQRRSIAADAVVFSASVNRTVKYRNNSIEDVTIEAVSEDYDKLMSLDIGIGRYFSGVDFTGGKNVALIGHDIAENLFQNTDPTGKRVKIFGTKVEVIGVMKKEGEDIFGNSADGKVLIPVNFARNYLDLRNVGNTTLMVKAKDGVGLDELKDELTGILRSVRSLKPRAKDNFAINEIDILTDEINTFFNTIAIVGWIIGGFSLLVGGFGIANIMFVSVKERTNIIGIQKSLGCKRYFILIQFLSESIFLSLLGGMVGLLLIYILTILPSESLGMNFILTRGNIAIGLGVSAVIGLISGLVPAMQASKLDPVEAMRSSF